MNACTIVARNYLPFARVLAESFRNQHPEGRFTVLVIDDLALEVNGASEGFDVLRLSDIGLATDEINAMAMIYDVTELATAVKPWLLRHLVREQPPPIVYFDPDIWISASVDDITERALTGSIVLTPHTVVPMAQDDRTPAEADILGAGVFNLGFIALGPGSEQFLDWWAKRLRRDAIRDVERHLFTDQRWIDFLPGYWPHYIVRDEGCNVAYWNIDKRELSWSGERYEVNRVPLRFFHFSGFHPDDPHLLTKHHAERPRILLSERPVLAELCREYAERLREAGFGSGTATYAYDRLPGGLKIDRFMRRGYRRALAEAEVGVRPPPPDPFGARSPDVFIDWLNAPIGNRTRGRITRYLYEIYFDRADLRAALPLVPGPDSRAFLRWARSWGRHEYNIPELLLPEEEKTSRARRSATPSKRQPGFNVAGYFRAELGIGEGVRLTVRAVEASGIPFSTVLYDRTTSRQSHPFDVELDAAPIYDTNLVQINADRFPSFAKDIGEEFFSGRYTVGLWAWEVEQFPTSLGAAFRHVDEVWLPSEFARRAVQDISPRPVFSFPHPIVSPAPTNATTRADLGLVERYTFLFAFDFLSVFERKNPIAVIDAFRKAFAPDEGPILVLKAINGDQRPADAERLRLAAAGHPDVHLIERYLFADEKNALMSLCDSYVSLHRSEGFGLTMAEAMALGKPVIATGYSGNLEYMHEKNSYLVPYELTPIPEGCDPYPPGASWATPDIDAAAHFMRYVYENPSEALEKGGRAREEVLRSHGPDARAQFVKQRFQAIRRLGPTLPMTARLVNPARSSVGAGASRARGTPARLLLRITRHPAEFIMHPPPRYRGLAAVVRRTFRRPFRLLRRLASAIPDSEPGSRDPSEVDQSVRRSGGTGIEI